jgi:hypothetical protein
MADPSEQTPVVKDEAPQYKPSLDPIVRKLVIFLSSAVLVLALSVWMMILVPRPVGGILALLGGALAFATLLHVARRTNGD